MQILPQDRGEDLGKNSWPGDGWKIGGMPNWPAMLLAPLIALANTGVAYALTSPSCAQQDTSTLHVLTIRSLLACLLVTFGALLNWQQARALAGPGETPDQSRRRFLSQAATLCGLLSALVVAAEWLPIWMVSPCYG